MARKPNSKLRFAILRVDGAVYLAELGLAMTDPKVIAAATSYINHHGGRGRYIDNRVDLVLPVNDGDTAVSVLGMDKPPKPKTLK